jgi:predicted esterase
MVTIVVASAACVQIPAPVERKDLADDLAARNDWVGKVVELDSFSIQTYSPKKFVSSKYLVIYFEGDGLAWLSSTRPSIDPSPLDPVGLKMALRHPGQHAIAYLARPCQYVLDKRCRQSDWTDQRFSVKVIKATDQVVDKIKQSAGASRLVLVGYSGGAAVAALVSSIRQDVDVLVTVAGNLDINEWVRYHHISPLRGSLNPADQAGKLNGLAQVHFVGAKDSVIPINLVNNFTRFANNKSRVHVLTQETFDHVCCWSENWPFLWPIVERQLKKNEDFE